MAQTREDVIRDRQDLTQGSIGKKLLMFSIPIIGGTLVQQLYNVVDSLVVGNFVGSDALAAVSASFSSMMVFNALFMGLSTGANIIISQYKGAQDHDSLERAMNATVTLSLLLGIFITVVGYIMCKPLLLLLKTPENIMGDSLTYIRIIFIGTIGNILYNGLTGMVRGLGDTKYPFYALLIASVMNIILDLLFVIAFHWDVAGVAWATIISQFCSGLFILFRLFGDHYPGRLTLKGLLRLDGPIIKTILQLGIPSAIQDVAMSLGFMVVQRVSNSFGSDYIASSSIVMKADGFAVMPMMGLGTAITTFVGQNIGAGNRERVNEGVKKVNWVTAGIGLAVGIILFFCGKWIGRAFTDNAKVIEMTGEGLKILAFCYIFMGLRNIYAGALRGAGAVSIAAITTLAGTLVRIPLAWLMGSIPMNRAIKAAVAAGTYASEDLARAAGVGQECYRGMFASMAVSMLLAWAISFAFYKFSHWQDKGITAQAKAASEK